ncbi:MAG: hypothetical protein WD851_12340 [Pirellulales bacterium]
MILVNQPGGHDQGSQRHPSSDLLRRLQARELAETKGQAELVRRLLEAMAVVLDAWLRAELLRG